MPSSGHLSSQMVVGMGGSIAGVILRVRLRERELASPYPQDFLWQGGIGDFHGGTSLKVQWLTLSQSSQAGAMGLITPVSLRIGPAHHLAWPR